MVQLVKTARDLEDDILRSVWILHTSILLFFEHMQSPMNAFVGLLSEQKLEKHAKVNWGGMTRQLLGLWTGI